MPLTDPQRENIVQVARSWIKTPYRDCSCTKGAGVDCGQLLKGVFLEAGHRPADGVPVPETYSTQIWLHKKDTSYIDTITKYMREIPESEVKPGDVVMYQMGRGFAHGAIIVKWPEHIVHALQRDGVCSGHGGQGQISTNATFSRMKKKFFTVKDEFCGETK
jgi:cell wall-associated NlpC family hydrolase